MMTDDVARLTAQLDELRRQVNILAEQTTIAVGLLQERTNLLYEALRLPAGRNRMQEFIDWQQGRP